MREDSEELAMLNTYGDGNRVLCWGAEFPMNSGNSGYGIATTGALLGALAGITNDLVVPTHSALGFGMPQPVLNCSHTQYFERPEVQAAIRNFYPAPVAAPAGVAVVAVPSSGGRAIQRFGNKFVVEGPVNMMLGEVGF